MTKKQLSGRLAIALGATFAVSLTATSTVNAEENPFQMSTFDTGYAVAAAEAAKDAGDEDTDAPGRDMEGNLVDYEYGGDSKGSYAEGKIGTGAKDPGVCGTFTGATCGADGGSHLKK